jgi:hydrogenase-4 component F
MHMNLLLLLILIPAAAGLAAFAIGPDRPRRILLLATAALHVFITGTAAWHRPPPLGNGWLALDDLGLLFLAITSLLFLAAALYAVPYLAHEKPGAQADRTEPFLFVNAPEATFTGCLLFFLATMTLVCLTQRLGLLWVGLEATTLTSAPLIYYHRHHRSLEALWKYLVICSVGIALALLGNFCLSAATVQTPGGAAAPLALYGLIGQGHAGALQPAWLKAAFIFILVGYGTKAGLAPLHAWMPDTYSEAPALVALLSGALLNCALLGILRAFQVCLAADLGAFARDLLVLFGLFSMAVAAVFLLRQRNYPRMLAYSSIEHMGIITLGVGLGGIATAGALFHALNHSLAKAMLFLVAGNILTLYQTKEIAAVRGLGRAAPVTAALWLAGFFAITGAPPFATFLSELQILLGALSLDRWGVAALYLGLLAAIFIGMLDVFPRMVWPDPVRRGGGAPPVAGTLNFEPSADTAVPDGSPTPPPEPRHYAWRLLPPCLLAAALLVLGLAMPPALAQFFERCGMLIR